MTNQNGNKLSAQSILENLTRTLLYEGYSLYPYHRSAIKNQKPVPFGVVFPQSYNSYNEHSHAMMQSQCIITGNEDSLINITVRFLHLKKTELFEKNENAFIPVYNLNIKDKIYQAGWQTVERKISTGDLPISSLVENKKIISLEFNRIYDNEAIYDDEVIAGRQINRISEITGTVTIEASTVDIPDTFRLTVTVANTTPVQNAGAITRDEALCQSFLSTHLILEADDAKFISQQDPGEKWKTAVNACENKNTWPILIDEADTMLLSSPIILYDHPQINPQSQGDLFDSTEIEEALLLHVSVLSDDEKKRIGNSDEKLQHMLNKVSQVTPEELINFHGVMKHNEHDQIINKKNSEL